MRYGSICSGIEAASVAWHPLGWTPAWFAEIDSFPCSLLKHHYPEVINFGDFTTIRPKWLKRIGSAPIDLLVGGTPCQSFSVAGKRLGMDDPRGNLAIEFAILARRLRPRWIVWENVPGVLSSWSDAEEDTDGGRWQRNDFDTFLALLGECGYGTSWRILDAQYFGVPQRRRRVFVVGHLGDWRPAAAVLFERESLRGYPAPSRKPGEGTTHEVAPSLTSSGRGVERSGETRGQDPVIAVHHSSGDGYWQTGAGTLRAREQESHEHLVSSSTGDIAHCLNAGGMGRIDYETETFITHTLRGDGFDASEDGTGRGTPLVPVAYRTSGNCGAWETGDKTDALTTGTDPNATVLAFPCKDSGADAGELSPTLRAMEFAGSHQNGGGQVAVTVALRGRDGGAAAEMGDDVAGALSTGGGGGNKAHALIENAVRRLTPRECERLQGFPDDYTAVTYPRKIAADGPRYKALGNSMAVPVMAWIGRRIDEVDRILREKRRNVNV